MSKIIKRNKNIDEKINEIQEIQNKFDLTLEKSITTGSYQKQFSDAYHTRKDSDETSEFFSVVEKLYDLAGYHHIGTGILYTHYYTTDDWEKYREMVMPIIESYIEYYLWDDICNSEWDE